MSENEGQKEEKEERKSVKELLLMLHFEGLESVLVELAKWSSTSLDDFAVKQIGEILKRILK